jgi:hypothetical protein
MPIVLRLVEGCAPFVSLGFVFVVRIRVRYGILDYVCTDTITAMPPCVWIFLISLQEISLQPEKEEI